MTERNLEDHLIDVGATIRDVAERLEYTKRSILLVVRNGTLVGTITEGDLRRAYLTDCRPESPATEIMASKPIVVTVDTPLEERQELLRRHRIQDLPVVDERGQPVDIFSLRPAASRAPRCFLTAVVMAGGEGRRLRPLTDDRPKPLVEVHGKPILEHIVERLASSGIAQIYLAINYRGNMIQDHFGDGSRWGVSISYLRESRKLGTAGALSLLPRVPAEPLLVMNGDLLTSVDFGALWAFHVKHRAVMTVGSVEYIAAIPYGRLQLASHFVVGVEEKPEVRFRCAAGIYVLEPEVIDFINADVDVDMPVLIREVIRAGLPVSAFPIRESWVDVGTPGDLPG